MLNSTAVVYYSLIFFEIINNQLNYSKSFFSIFGNLFNHHLFLLLYSINIESKTVDISNKICRDSRTLFMLVKYFL